MSEDLQPLATPPMAYQFGAALAKLQGRALEISCLGDIIAHHQMAVEMARLELERGMSPGVRTHAKHMMAEHQQLIDQFTRWLREWYGLTPHQAMEQAPAEARQRMMPMASEAQHMMEKLRAVPKGKAFDVVFVQHVIHHLTSGIIEFLEPQTRAVHDRLREAAAAGATSQEKQIAEFLTWLAGQGGKQEAMPSAPKGAAATGDGASHAGTAPLAAGGALLSAVSGGVGAVALRRRLRARRA